jgi:hypothetical protein
MNMPSPAAKTPAPAKPAAPKPFGSKAAAGLIGLVIGLVAGYGAGRVSTGTPVNPLSGKGGGYQEGYEAAKKKLVESGLIAPEVEPDVRTIRGKVKSVGADFLTLEVNVRPPDPLAPAPAPRDVKILVTGKTALFRRTEKSPEEFRKDVEAYGALQPAPDEPVPPPPEPHKDEPISLKDIKQGDEVSVTAETNVYGKAEFEASRVDVLPPIPPPPQASEEEFAPSVPTGGPATQ